MAFDDELDRIAVDADRRLAFQSYYPVVACPWSIHAARIGIAVARNTTADHVST
ncbi:hypothetical protein HGA13_21635 [Nocardia speluncae]|uniref:Uncharacterized protein n=1 Tax=Nocardia speluncae TaxID=419477 RepID=A0A846XM73_9NOCA|nr:hypothetical protein [Nocardia speluncae]NKY35653.1 hypothetical protein [Nocardia speluncae]